MGRNPVTSFQPGNSNWAFCPNATQVPRTKNGNCFRCGKPQLPTVTCEGNPFTCFLCKGVGHKANVCPNKGKTSTPSASGAAMSTSATRINGKLFMMTEMEEDGGDYADIITGTFLINSVPACILFDTGASLSHVSPTFIFKAKLVNPEKIDSNIALPNGQTLRCSARYSDVPINILGSIFPANLLRLPLPDLDIILGKDWLSK